MHLTLPIIFAELSSDALWLLEIENLCEHEFLYDFSQGVRDLLKVILEKILTIPNTVSSAVVQQLLAAREVIL